MTAGRAVYRPKHRLTRSLEYRAVYAAKLRAPAGPITVFVRPNGLGHPRLGLSIGRRVGNAVDRNGVKRRLRDAFREIAAGWPDGSPGLDIVISARAHDRATPREYAELIRGALRRLRGPIERATDHRGGDGP